MTETGGGIQGCGGGTDVALASILTTEIVFILGPQ